MQGTNLLLQVHDDLLIEVPEEEMKYWAINLKKSMEEAINLIIPLEVHLYSGYNWRDMKIYQL
ncbi:MAG: DNA polymerase I [candidate division WS2 bacterium]|nr:DNA polymerase I [Candidatus Lithacetigena glycinireducens]